MVTVLPRDSVPSRLINPDTATRVVEFVNYLVFYTTIITQMMEEIIFWNVLVPSEDCMNTANKLEDRFDSLSTGPYHTFPHIKDN